MALLALLFVPRQVGAQQLSSSQLEAVLRGAASIDVPLEGTRVPLLGPPELPLVEVRLNGVGPYRFLLDLGSNVVILRRGVADEAGLEIVLDREESDIVRARRLEIGSATFEDVWLGAYDELDVDGVIGYNLLMGTGIVIDYVGRSFRMGQLHLPEPDGDRVLDYEVEARLPFVHARAGDHEMLMNLDTGAANWIVLPLAMADSIPVADSLQAGPALWNNQTGTTRNYVARLAVDIEFGGFVIERPVVLFDPAVEEPWLGSALLAHSCLEMDTRRQVLRLTTEQKLVSPAYRTLGLALGTPGPTGGARPVTDLIPGTDAARKLKLGDAIRMIGGIPAGELDGPARRKLATETDRVEVVLIRDGVPLSIMVDVSSLPR